MQDIKRLKEMRDDAILLEKKSVVLSMARGRGVGTCKNVRTPFGLCKIKGMTEFTVFFEVPIKKINEWLSDHGVN